MGLAVNHSAGSSSYYTFAIRGVSGELVLTSLSLFSLLPSLPLSSLPLSLLSLSSSSCISSVFLSLFFFPSYTHICSSPNIKAFIKVTSLLQGVTFFCPCPHSSLLLSYMCVYGHRVWIQLGFLWKKRRRESFLQKELFSFPQFCHSLEKLFNSSESKRSLIKL